MGGEMLKGFKEFIARGNVLDMTVGIVVGTAFAAIAKSLAADVIMPPIGLVLGKVDFGNLFLVIREGAKAGPYSTLADAQAAGAVTLNYGVFLNSVVSFLIVAFAVFLIVRSVNKLHRQQAAAPAPVTKRDCPFCKMGISLQAVRCPHCTSNLEELPVGG
jgi:large conductance mechanosensitive channel